MGPTRASGRSCRQRGESRGHTATLDAAGRRHSLGCNSVCQHRTNTSPGANVRALGTGHRSSQSSGVQSRGCGQPGQAVVALAGGGRGGRAPCGYLDSVLQAVAHGRADLLVVTEQSG